MDPLIFVPLAASLGGLSNCVNRRLLPVPRRNGDVVRKSAEDVRDLSSQAVGALTCDWDGFGVHEDRFSLLHGSAG